MLDAALHAVIVATETGDDGGNNSVLVPFLWQGVSLHAAGASSVRARIVPIGPSAVSVELADGLGLPVLSVASMVARPVSQQQLMAAVSGAGADRIFAGRMAVATSGADCTSIRSVEVFGLGALRRIRRRSVAAGNPTGTHEARLRCSPGFLGTTRRRQWWRPAVRWRCRARMSRIWRALRCGDWCVQRRPSIPVVLCWWIPMRRLMMRRSPKCWRLASRRC